MTEPEITPLEIAQAIANVDALHTQAQEHLRAGRDRVAAALYDETAKAAREAAKTIRGRA